MKRLTYMLLVSLIVILAVCCSKENTTLDGDVQFDLKNMDIRLPGLHFDDLYDDKVIELSSNSNKELLEFIDELFEFERYVVSTDSSSLGLEYRIRHLGTYFEARDLISVNEDIQTEFIATCPEGLEKFRTCRSMECVEDAIRTLGSHMGSGDSFYVHRGHFGATICANPELIERAHNGFTPPDD